MGYHHAKRKILGTIISNRILIGFKFGNKRVSAICAHVKVYVTKKIAKNSQIQIFG
jgi:hypothetical protein